MNPPHKNWVIGAGIAFTGCVAAVFIPAFSGQPFTNDSSTAVWLSAMLFFALLWRYRNRRGRVGVFWGFLASLAVFFLAGFIRASMR